jgi:hypothetical protein
MGVNTLNTTAYDDGLMVCDVLSLGKQADPVRPLQGRRDALADLPEQDPQVAHLGVGRLRPLVEPRSAATQEGHGARDRRRTPRASDPHA